MNHAVETCPMLDRRWAESRLATATRPRFVVNTGQLDRLDGSAVDKSPEVWSAAFRSRGVRWPT